MKKLYRKCTVHPSPPLISDHLAFLPATILTLTVALSPEDKEVLAYLISFSKITTKPTPHKSNGGKSNTDHHHDHQPVFNCDCFRCYTSYWARWDSSPNRQLIHEIIDAYEDVLAKNNINKGGKNISKKERRKKGKGLDHGSKSSDMDAGKAEMESAGETSGGKEGAEEEDIERGSSVRKFVSFLGERIWGPWSN